MLIECKNCKKRYNIPDEKIAALGKRVVLPCPACKEKIEIIPENIGRKEAKIPAVNQSSSGLPTGENLKNNILSSIKDLAPKPQVAQKAREVVSEPDSNFKNLAKVIENRSGDCFK